MGSRRFLATGLVVLAAGVLAACGRVQEPSQPGGSPSIAPSASKGVKMTLRGEVEEGVEAGCMLLRAEDSKVYLLLGGDRQMIAQGARLEVVGEAQPELLTTCQQGIPFTVTETRRI